MAFPWFWKQYNFEIKQNLTNNKQIEYFQGVGGGLGKILSMGSVDTF